MIRLYFSAGIARVLVVQVNRLAKDNGDINLKDNCNGESQSEDR